MRPGERETCLRALRENLADVDARLTGVYGMSGGVLGNDRVRALRRDLEGHRGTIEKALHILEREAST